MIISTKYVVLLFFRPIAVMMVLNICMFIYSSFRLYNMQKNVHTVGGKKTPYKYSSSRYTVKSTPSESDDQCLSRKQTKVESGVEGNVVLSRTDSENENNGQSDGCQSPAEDEVFDQQSSSKAKSYAKSLTSKIPTAKLSRQISKMNNHKDR